VCLSLWFVCADFRPRCLILMPTLFGLSADAVRVSTDVIHASARVFHASARAVRKPRQRGSHCFVLTPAARHTLIFVHMLPFSCHIFAKTTRRAMSARGVRFSARAVHLSSRVGRTSAHTLFGRWPACGAAVSSCVEECRVAARARHATRPLASSVLEYRVSGLLVQAVFNRCRGVHCLLRRRSMVGARDVR